MPKGDGEQQRRNGKGRGCYSKHTKPCVQSDDAKVSCSTTKQKRSQQARRRGRASHSHVFVAWEGVAGTSEIQKNIYTRRHKKAESNSSLSCDPISLPTTTKPH